MAATRTNLGGDGDRVFAATTRPLAFTVRDANGDAVDVSSWAMSFLAGDQALTTGAGDIDVATQGASGIATVTLSTTHTSALADSTVDWELRRTDSGNEEVVAYGKLTVKAVVS